MSYAHLGFELATDHTQLSALKTVARFVCTECAATTESFVTSNKPLDPEGLAKKVRSKGWIAEARRRGKTLCPRCASQRPAHDPDSEIKKVIPMTVTPIKPTAEVRDPTPDQRVFIRSYLDKSFDDAVGAYLDGMNDQRIAELAGVPRAIVERMREAAYGPIRLDPELADLRQTLETLRKEVDAQQRGLDGTKSKLAEASSKLERKIAGKAA